MGKKCDLCGGVARLYCESDQASLCLDCDGKVHGANFLVAKHTRCLLCDGCQAPTPWKATGLRLGPTFSVCDSCVALKNAGGGIGSGRGGVSTNRFLTEDRGQEINGFDYEEDRLREDGGDGDGAESYDDDEDEDEDDEYSDEDDNEDDEEADNQVVPLAVAAQPPPVMSSSSFDGGSGDLVAKRARDCSDDEIGCSSGQESNYARPLKRPSRNESTAVINSIIRLEGERAY